MIIKCQTVNRYPYKFQILHICIKSVIMDVSLMYKNEETTLFYRLGSVLEWTAAWIEFRGEGPGEWWEGLFSACLRCAPAKFKNF